MKGLALIIVGYQGAGKTLLTKQLIKNIHPERLRIMDVNNEYGVGRPDFEVFTNQMINETEKVFIVEDATVIFSHRGYNRELVESVISKRHTKNVYVFLFHSLRVVPRDVFEYSDELWLLKTADTDDTLNSKYKGTGVQELLDEVRTLPEFEWSEKQQFPVRDIHYKVLQIKKGKLDQTVENTCSNDRETLQTFYEKSDSELNEFVKKYPGNMGGVSDEGRKHPEFLRLKRQFDIAHKNLADYNAKNKTKRTGYGNMKK